MTDISQRCQTREDLLSEINTAIGYWEHTHMKPNHYVHIIDKTCENYDAEQIVITLTGDSLCYDYPRDHGHYDGNGFPIDVGDYVWWWPGAKTDSERERRAQKSKVVALIYEQGDDRKEHPEKFWPVLVTEDRYKLNPCATQLCEESMLGKVAYRSGDER